MRLIDILNEGKKKPVFKKKKVEKKPAKKSTKKEKKDNTEVGMEPGFWQGKDKSAKMTFEA